MLKLRGLHWVGLSRHYLHDSIILGFSITHLIRWRCSKLGVSVSNLGITKSQDMSLE